MQKDPEGVSDEIPIPTPALTGSGSWGLCRWQVSGQRWISSTGLPLGACFQASAEYHSIEDSLALSGLRGASGWEGLQVRL